MPLQLLIKNIEAVQLTMRYKAELAPHLIRSGLINFGNRMTLYRLELEDGTVGHGDAMGPPEDVSAFVGYDAVAGLRQIHHAGVQMACYDAVGRALDLPAHVLMGRQLRPRTAMAYWTAEVPPPVLATQVKKAAAQGYRVYKTKCRPWWDPIEQVKAAAAVAPAGFRLWLDFNGHLRDSRQALRVMKELSNYEIVGGFESPVPQRDAATYRLLRQQIDRPIAAHYGSGCCHVRSVPGFDPGVPAIRQVADGLCDALVLGGGDVDEIRRRAGVAQEAGLPFWIQTIGSGLRAAWVAHLASTCRQAVLSNLAAHTIWERDITTLPPVLSGHLAVPQGPGLGVEVDSSAVEALSREPLPILKRHLTSVVYPDGSRWHFCTEQQRHETYYLGEATGFESGIRLETRYDDDSADFDDLFRRCTTAPVIEKN
jgi:L-alanine-DL-glutamate epimerase-like enolase superfamily enzyme